MQRTIILFLSIIITTFSHEVYGQYPPIGILPMEYNPSFAGSVGNSRLVSNFSFYKYDQNAYSSIGVGIDLSYDNYFPGFRSGIGIIAKNGYSDMNNGGNSIGNSLELIAAPKISRNGKYTLSPSISIMYYNLYSKNDNSWSSLYDGFSSKFGLLLNTSHYYIGYAAEYLYGSSDLTTALQFGYTFQKSIDSKFSFTPQLVLPIFLGGGIGVYWPSYNLGFRYQNFIFGAISQFNYPYPTGFQIGWQKKGWRLILNNDFALEYVANFTLRYIFNHDKKSRNILY